MWHHPEKAQEIDAARRKGGRNSAPAVRARKRFAGTEKDLAGLWSTCLDAIEKVQTGEIEVSQANALANLIRAAQSLSTSVLFQHDLETLRRELEEIRRLQGPAA